MPSYPGRKRAWLVAAALLPVSLILASCTTEPQSAGNGGTNGAPPANTTGSTDTSTGASALFEKPRKADGDVAIQIVTNGLSPFWDSMRVGMERTRDELKCKADWTYPQPAEVGNQKQLIESAIAKDVDGVAISCIEAKASESVINDVVDKGIPVITFDSDSPGSKRLAYIGTNNFEAGKRAGEEALKLLPSGGKFVGFVGNITAQNARERADGFKEATQGKIEVVQIYDDLKDPAQARKNVEAALNKYGDQVQGFLGLFSYNAPAIADALVAANVRSKYKVVCFDLEPNTQKHLAAGNIDVTIVQKPYEFGKLCTQLLYEINRVGLPEAKKKLGIPENGIFDTGVDVVTPKNISEFKKKLDELGVTSS